MKCKWVFTVNKSVCNCVSWQITNSRRRRQYVRQCSLSTVLVAQKRNATVQPCCQKCNLTMVLCIKNAVILQSASQNTTLTSTTHIITSIKVLVSSVLLRCCHGDRKGIRPEGSNNSQKITHTLKTLFKYRVTGVTLDKIVQFNRTQKLQKIEVVQKSIH